MADELPIPAPRRARSPAAWTAAALFLVVFATPFLTGRRGDRWDIAVAAAENEARASDGGLVPTDASRGRWRTVVGSLSAPGAPFGALLRAALIAREGLDGPAGEAADARARGYIARLDAAPSRIAPDARQALRRWAHAVYFQTRPLSLEEAREFRATVQSASLGRYGPLALAQLEARAGRADEAARLRAELSAHVAQRQRTSRRVGGSLGLMALAGLVPWIVYVSELRRRRAADRPAPLLSKPHVEPILWALCAYLAAQYAAGWGFAGLVRAGLAPSRGLWAVASLVEIAIDTFSLWFLVRQMKRHGVDRRALGFTAGRVRDEVAWGVAGYTASLPALIVSALLVNKLFPNVPSVHHPMSDALSGPLPAWRVAVLAAQAAVVAPVFEEVFFRGTLLNSIWARAGSRWAGLVLSSAVFAVLHPQIYFGWIQIFVLGMVFGTLFVERRSLLPGVVMHAVNNGVTVALARLVAGD